MNMGQLLMILRAKYLVDAQGYNKIQGKPFKTSEIEQKIEEMLGLTPSLAVEDDADEQAGEQL
jgi:2-oxoglutarate ferredoxin oxidoreductase subunit alpha